MQIEDFKIGEFFYGLAGFKWLCTDIGTRTIVAIHIDSEMDKAWFIGPPYSVEEVVFDISDMDDCYLEEHVLIRTRIEGSEKSSHPNFSSEDVFKMMESKFSGKPYPRSKVLKKDRVSKTGLILHPYSAIKKQGLWYILTFELFSREYSEMLEDDFIKLEYSTEESMSQRAESFNKLNHS